MPLDASLATQNGQRVPGLRSATSPPKVELVLCPPPPSPCHDLQKKVYDSIIADHFSSCLADIVHTRISNLFTPYDIDAHNVQTHNAIELLKKLRKHDAMRVIKTWVNSWSTSDRFHEAIRLPCLFGCPHLDRQQHYVFCPILFYLTAQIIPTSNQPLERIGIANPTIGSLKAVACVFFCISRRQTQQNN